MLSKKITLVLGLLVIASMVLAACQPASTPETVVETVIVTVEGEGETVVQVVTPTPEPVAVPDTLVICIGQEPDTLNAYNTDMLAASQVQEAVYDGGAQSPYDNRTFAYQAVITEKLPNLADGDAVINQVTVAEGAEVTDVDKNPIVLDPAADPQQMLMPSGATEAVPYTGGEVTLDQMVVTFKLRPGLMWDDGTPLTAADSVYSFNLAADPDTNATKYAIERTASYEATDDVTLVWTGLPGYTDATYFINLWQPLPEHVWGQYTAAELKEVPEANEVVTGYGPYKIIEWTKGDNIRLEKNPNYWRAAEGLPKFDNLVFRFVGEDANSAIAAVLSGECDIIDQTTSLESQAQLLLELQAAGQINPTFVTGTVWEHVDFTIQHVSYDDGYQAGTDRPDFFSDVRVRQAFANCIDRQTVVDTVMYGQSIAPDVYIPPNHPLYNADVTVYPFDVAAGQALLAEAGWTDTNGDGTVDKDGVEMVVRYETTTATLRQQVTQIVSEQLKACGIGTTLNYYPSGEWFADGPDGPLFGRQVDLGEFAWLTGVEPACDLYMSELTPGPQGETFTSIMDGETHTFTSGWGGQNNPGFVNAEYDAACKGALGSLPGLPAYEENHKLAQKIFSEQLPVIPLYLRIKLAATRTDMCNFFMDPTENSEMWNIEEFAYGPLCE